jgi:hypothetical protein
MVICTGPSVHLTTPQSFINKVSVVVTTLHLVWLYFPKHFETNFSPKYRNKYFKFKTKSTNTKLTHVYTATKMADSTMDDLGSSAKLHSAGHCDEMSKWKAISLTHVEYLEGKVYRKHKLHVFLCSSSTHARQSARLFCNFSFQLINFKSMQSLV